MHDLARSPRRSLVGLTAARPPAAAGPESGPDLKLPGSVQGGGGGGGSGGTLAAATSPEKALDAVLAISRDLSAAPTLRALLCAALRAAAELVRAQQAVIYLTGEDDGSVLIVHFPQDELGTRDKSGLEVLRLPRNSRSTGPGVAGHVLLSGAAARVDSAQDDNRFSAEVDRAPGYIVESLICAPVLSAPGKPIGAVTLANKLSSRPGPTESTPRPFDANDERCLALLCSLLGPALERQMLRDDDFYRR